MSVLEDPQQQGRFLLMLSLDCGRRHPAAGLPWMTTIASPGRTGVVIE